MKIIIIFFIIISALFILNIQQYNLPNKPIAPIVTHQSELPIISITADSIENGIKRPAYIEIISNDINESLGPYPASIELGGNTAYKLPKKRFNISFANSKDWTQTISRSVLSLPADDDWILDPSFRDRLIFRNKISHDIFSLLNPKYSSIKSKFAEAYLNGEYIGLYLISQKPDRNFFRIQKSNFYGTFKAQFVKYFEKLSFKVRSKISYRINRDISRIPLKLSNLFQSPIHLSDVLYKTNIFGNNLSGELGLSQKYPHQKLSTKASNAHELTSFITQSSKENFRSNIWKRIDRDTTMKYLALLMLNSGFDNMKANFILLFIDNIAYIQPWDLDYTFGAHNPKTGLVQINETHWAFDQNAFFKRIFAADDPIFLGDLINYWFELRKDEFSSINLKNMFKLYFSQANTSEALKRNHEFWKLPDPYIEFERTLDWLDKRLVFIDEKLKKVRADLLDK